MKKRKIIKLKNDADTYFDLGDDALDAGDYINAVHYFYTAYTKGGGEDALYYIGETYCDMGEYDEALHYLFRALNKRPDCPDIHATISMCFLSMNDEDTALFYAFSQMDMAHYNDTLFNKDNHQEPQKIRLLEKNDHMLIDIAAKLLSAGDKKYAKELLQTIKPDSPDFLKACNLLIMLALEDKQAKEALKTIDMALKQNTKQKESGIFLEFRCWEIAAYHILKDKENKERVIDIVENAKLDFHASRAAVFTYAKIGDHKRIRRHIENVLKEDAYNKNMLVMLAVAHYLCGDAKAAKDEIVAAAKLYPGDISIKEIALAFSQKRKGFILTALIDKKTAGNWIDDVEEGLAFMAKGRYEDVADKADFKQKIEWVFQSRLNSLVAHAAIVLAKQEDFKEFLLEKLLDHQMEVVSKKAILYSLLVNKVVTKFGIVLDGFYQKLALKQFNAQYDKVFRAYCKTFATLVFMESGFETRLLNAAKKVDERFNELLLDDSKDEDIIPAILFSLVIKNKLPLAHSAFIFGCDEDELEWRIDYLLKKK